MAGYDLDMTALAFLGLTLGGGVELANYCFDDSLDSVTEIRGYLAMVCVAVGATGLICIGVWS